MSNSSFGKNRQSQGKTFLGSQKNLALRLHYQIAFVYQPMMKLIGGIPAIDLAYPSYLLVLVGTLLLSLQLCLNGALHVLAEFSSFVVHIPFD
jgi:hypothetical protein